MRAGGGSFPRTLDTLFRAAPPLPDGYTVEVQGASRLRAVREAALAHAAHATPPSVSMRITPALPGSRRLPVKPEPRRVSMRWTSSG